MLKYIFRLDVTNYFETYYTFVIDFMAVVFDRRMKQTIRSWLNIWLSYLIEEWIRLYFRNWLYGCRIW